MGVDLGTMMKKNFYSVIRISIQNILQNYKSSFLVLLTKLLRKVLAHKTVKITAFKTYALQAVKLEQAQIV